MDNAHSQTVDEVLAHFGTNKATGLSAKQVEFGREKYGYNGILEKQLFMFGIQSFRLRRVNLCGNWY